jgi:5-methylcytosine-specific restriction endonuclease McrA
MSLICPIHPFVTMLQPMSYLPLSVSHWQEAIKLIFSGKVAVVDVYEGVTIRAANLEVPLPSVIALNDYVPQCSHKPAFTRRNVFLRDEYTCQYCNNMFHAKDLSIDHVVPRSMGGRLSWYASTSVQCLFVELKFASMEISLTLMIVMTCLSDRDNAVTSCLSCNGRKGNKLLSDLKSLGMKLQTKPCAPTRHELAIKAGKMLPRKVHPTWQPFLGSLWDDDDTARPDFQALGINFHGESLQKKLQDQKQPRKVISRNSKKKAKKQQQQKKDLQDSGRRR